jgi:signal transduction histidine kinase
VRIAPALRGVARRLRRPKTTVRWRLTLLYGGLFLVSGAALLAITYTLVDNAVVFPQRSTLSFVGRRRAGGNAVVVPRFTPGQSSLYPGAKPLPPPLAHLLRTRQGQKALGDVIVTQRVADMHQLIIESALALAVMALISTALGWVVAGRVLRPLRTMTAATQEISEENLNRRLAMQGPRDELRQLADTIDGLLGRMEGAFDAQRRFVANASHELRTPLTAVRALLEMVLSDPTATVATFRATCEQVLEESGQQEQLIEALLTLAQGQRGIDRAESFDLAALVSDVVSSREGMAAGQAVEMRSSLAPATIAGDARLVARLVSNLVDNAIRHNVAQGRVDVAVRAGGLATLSVANTGPVVPEAEVARLMQPFQRLSPDRTTHHDGLGLGFSIVAAVAGAHDAQLAVRARPDGGLEVEVDFPARATPPSVDAEAEPRSVQGGTTLTIG